MDVNGPTRGPNYFGRDVFMFRLTNGKRALLYPMGGADDGSAGWWKPSGNCSVSDVWGAKCAARIIEEDGR